jgi:hypothetical protein
MHDLPSIQEIVDIGRAGTRFGWQVLPVRGMGKCAIEGACTGKIMLQPDFSDCWPVPF